MEQAHITLIPIGTYEQACAASRTTINDELALLRFGQGIEGEQPLDHTRHFAVQDHMAAVRVISPHSQSVHIEVRPVDAPGHTVHAFNIATGEHTVHAYDAEDQVTAAYRSDGADSSPAALARLYETFELLFRFDAAAQPSAE